MLNNQNLYGHLFIITAQQKSGTNIAQWQISSGRNPTTIIKSVARVRELVLEEFTTERVLPGTTDSTSNWCGGNFGCYFDLLEYKISSATRRRGRIRLGVVVVRAATQTRLVMGIGPPPQSLALIVSVKDHPSAGLVGRSTIMMDS